MARFSLAFILPPLTLTGPVGITIMTVTLAVGAAFTAKEVLKKLMINHKSTASKEGQLYDDSLI